MIRHAMVLLITVNIPCLTVVSCSDDNDSPTFDSSARREAGIDAQLDSAIKDTTPADTIKDTSSADIMVEDSGVDCEALVKEYQTALAAARACNPLINAIQCVEAVDDDLYCPCSTYINPTNIEAVNKLNAISTEFKNYDCPIPGCSPEPCPEIQGGFCDTQPGKPGTEGICKDALVD